MLSHFVGMAVVRRPPASLSSSAALHRRPPLPRPVFSYPRSLFSFSSPLGKTRICCSAQRQALFNRIAPIYDDLNDLLSLGLHRSWKRMCISWSGAKKGDRALDLCCGSGDLTFLLSQKVGLQGEVCGLDFSREQLSIASVRQDLYWKASYQNIQWIEGDALNLPFPDCYFDAITMGYGLRNLVDRQKALREIFRVLKPGSKVSILDFNKSTSNLVNTAQEWMLDKVVVPVASNYGLSQEYEYLKGSIAEFLTGKELEKLVDEIGFSKARHYEIGGGFMGNLVATK
ncbi:2-phytyl-1,4-beta-naphthoquinone methyltransferase, chloroplastic-like isoform X2 [Zingiber officinale]|uniref:2-phytyl-1,4-beta-naphthoquinone methyltransferase, chloroplastic-like isoform X2 n=1 Tax=Zingiber officinale TaxID=94328 RepID=UPI001C4AC1D2|nr:2-phytyl-1,4-beta-naphthoquinone methyltransferase, chloroplastic-like isoform X2 [Zingiber officinale]